jgi:hypothetical protein
MQAVGHFEEMPMRLVGTFAVVLVASLPWPAASQSAPPAAEPYRPGLGDLMTMTVQPRHIKLSLAGRESNWAYAKYELHELQEAFDRVTRVVPKYRGLPLGGMIDAIAKGPMAEVAKAIEDKNSEQFAAAYANLTDGCNACHQAANVGQIVIKVPDASSFPDQDFRPRQP